MLRQQGDPRIQTSPSSAASIGTATLLGANEEPAELVSNQLTTPLKRFVNNPSKGAL